MPEYIEVGRLEQLPPGSGTTATVAGKELALFNVDETIYAIDDSCLHQGASLGSGKLEGKTVTCSATAGNIVTTGATLNSGLWCDLLSRDCLPRVAASAPTKTVSNDSPAPAWITNETAGNIARRRRKRIDEWIMLLEMKEETAFRWRRDTDSKSVDLRVMGISPLAAPSVRHAHLN